MAKNRKLSLMDLYCLSIGQVIGAGVITLVGPAIASTGLSAWLAYLLAILLGFSTIFPLVFICGTLKLNGGFYSLVGSLAGKRLAGIFAYAQLTNMISISLFAVSLGIYVKSIFPGVNSKVTGILFLTFFYLINLTGVNIMAKIQKYMTWILIASLLMFAGFGISRYNNPVLDFVGPEFMTGGSRGLITAMFLFVYSTTGYSRTMNYGASARNPKRDIPLALILSVPTLIVIYCGVAIAGACVLPIAQVSNQPLTIVAQTVLPGALFGVFIIGGPIMALLTTMNSSMPSNCLPVQVSCQDGWLPESFGVQNRRGVAWKVMTANYLIGLVPLLLGFSVSMIVNNIQLLSSSMYLVCHYAYYKLPSRYPEAWKRSRWHVPAPVYYTIVTISLIGQLAILIDSVFSLTAAIAVISIISIIICCVLGTVRARNENIKVSTGVWQD